MSTWAQTLNIYSNRALSAMCAALDVGEYANRVGPDNRARAIERMRHVLNQPDTVRRALDRFGPAELAIVETLLRTPDPVPTERVLRAVAQDSTVQLAPPHAEAIPNYRGIPSFNDAVARATCYGIIFSRDTRTLDLNPGQYLIIPEIVAKAIKADKAWTTALAQRGTAGVLPQFVDDVPIAAGVSAADFQRDLSRYLRHVRRQNNIALTAQGWIYKTNFKTFLAALNITADGPTDEASNPRLWFMRRMLILMGELTLGEINTLHPREPSVLLNLPMAKRIKETYDVWCNSGAWNELNRIATPHAGYENHRDAPSDLARARGVVLRLLTRLVTSAITSQQPSSGAPPRRWHDRWFKTAQLIELIKRAEYQFLLPRRIPRGVYGGEIFSTPYYGNNNVFGMTFSDIRDEAKGWDLVERQFIVKVLAEPLTWMGLITLGYTKADDAEPLAFRLTETGAWLLGLGDPPTFMESGGRVLVQPNFTVIAMEPISDAVLLALDEFGESQGGDRAVSYHLTRQSVYRGQQKGWSAARIRAFLEEHQGNAIPANVQRTMDEWDAQHQRIVFYRSANVLHYADNAAREGAREALQSAEFKLTALAPLFDLAETTAPGKPANASASANAALAAAGWLPLIEGRHATEGEDRMKVTEHGELIFKHAVPSILTLSQLLPFTEGDSQRRHISANSVRAAMTGGMTLDQLLATLAQLNAGPVPPAVENRIRGWAGFYGKASLSAVHLLELSSAEVLTNLLKDSEVGPYLTPIEGSAKPLALVQADHLKNVRAILVERGVEIS